MARGKLRVVDGYYFAGELEEHQIDIIDSILNTERVENLKNILNNVNLKDFQTIDAAFGYASKKAVIGESPGTGKTVIVSAILEILKRKNELDGKILAVTKGDALYQFSNEIERLTNLKLLELEGSSVYIERRLKLYDKNIYSGVIIPESTILNNAFNKFLSTCMDEFKILILDDCSVLKNNKNKSYGVAKSISEEMDRVYILNGTLFETNLMDIVNQIRILGDGILPSKTSIENMYCNFDKNAGYWGSKLHNENGSYSMKRQWNRVRKLDIENPYKNQEDLQRKLKYFYIHHNKKDIYDQLPNHGFQLVPIYLSDEQSRVISSSNYDKIINSPTTYYPDFEFNLKTVPKINVLLDLVENILESKPVIYAWYKESQAYIQKYLKERKISSIILNGDVVSSAEKEKIRHEFDIEGKYDVLITNVQRAINLPNSDSLIFYNIPTNPMTAYQIMCRIDRNNETDRKMYYFLCAIDSQEADNLIEVTSNRELNANLFCGYDNTTFGKLAEEIIGIRKKQNIVPQQQN